MGGCVAGQNRDNNRGWQRGQRRLVDGAFEAVDALGEDLEEALKNVVPFFGIEILG